MAYNQSDGSTHNTGDTGKLVLGLNGSTYRAFALDSSGNLNVTSGAPSSIGDGSKAVTTAGTAETLIGSSTPCKKVLIWCSDGNTGAKAYVGGSTVSSTSGVAIYKGGVTVIEIDDLQKIYVDVDTSGDGVQFTYVS